MSLWRVGRESVRIGDPVLTPLDRSVAATRATEDGAGGPLGDIADTVAKWIPGEILALYVAGVTMIGEPNWLWLAVGIGLAPATVVLAAFTNSGRFRPTRRTGVRAGLGFLTMAIWSLAVPGSGWHAWNAVQDNPAAVALAAAAVGLLFGPVAEAVSRWADSRPPAPARPGVGDRNGSAADQAEPGANQPERTAWAPVGSVRPAGAAADPPIAEPPSRRGIDPQPLRMPSIPPLE